MAANDPESFNVDARGGDAITTVVVAVAAARATTEHIIHLK